LPADRAPQAADDLDQHLVADAVAVAVVDVLEPRQAALSSSAESGCSPPSSRSRLGPANSISFGSEPWSFIGRSERVREGEYASLGIRT
jgi:hypothetical protein